MCAQALAWAIAATCVLAAATHPTSVNVHGSTQAKGSTPILPMFFAGPPAGRWFNESETSFVLRHALVVVGAGGPAGPDGHSRLPAERATHEQVRSVLLSLYYVSRPLDGERSFN